MLSFLIQAPNLQIPLTEGPGGLTGKATASVTNQSTGEKTCLLRIRSETPEVAGWVTIAAPTERPLQPNQNSTVEISVSVPPGTPPGARSFQLAAADSENTDEDTTLSPAFTLDVPATAPPPTPRWPIFAAIAAVLVLLIGGGGWWWFTRAATVPDLAGLSIAAAETALTDAGLTLGTERFEETDSAAPDTVIAQDPAAETEVSRGSPVAVTLATEIPTVPVPDLIGQSQGAAEAALTAAGLTLGALTEVERADPAPGTVTGQNPAAGTDIRRGSAVALEVARALSAVTVPDIIGLSGNDAEARLSQAGLSFGGRTGTAISGRVPPAHVLSQSPTAGTSVPPGSAVTVTTALALREDCLGHTLSTLQVQNVGGRWTITQGRRLMISFGGDQNAANRALATLRHYNADKICYVERPNPPMTYILDGDTAPSGRRAGEDCIGFNAARLRLRDEPNGWLVTDGSSRMMLFETEDAGRTALAVIETYGFTHQCFVGRPNPPFSYFRR